MAKGLPTLDVIENKLDGEFLLPIYFIAGKDKFAVESALQQVKNAVMPLLQSDFDLEIYSLDKGNDFNNVLESATAFPFGSEKKLIIVRGFENVTDKSKLLPYVKTPADFTVLAITYNGEIRNVNHQPFKELNAKGYLFADRKLRASELAEWIALRARKSGISISRENALMLMEFTGEEKALLEMQIQKFAGYLNGKGEVTQEIIENLSSSTKEYNIFELQDAIGVGNKRKALKVCMNLLEGGKDILGISGMLTKFILTLASIHEFKNKGISNETAASQLGVSPYYYKKCAMAGYMLKEKRLHNAAKALLNLEIAVKTSTVEPKTAATLLIAEMLK